MSAFLRRLFTPPSARLAADSLYTACVRQARQPWFYSDLGVPDTVDGRFDMVVLHVFLVMARLRDAGGDGELQRLFQECLFADMDRSLREMGVGDLSVGKRVQDMASAYFGRLQAYEAALHAESDDALREALLRNVWRGASPGQEALAALAAYVLRQRAALAAGSLQDLCAGRVAFDAAAVKVKGR